MDGVFILEDQRKQRVLDIDFVHQILSDEGLYELPTLVPESVSDEELVRKYQDTIAYDGNFKDGYIYNSAVTAARLIEQQRLLFEALKPSSQKTPEQVDLIANIFVNQVFLYLRSKAAGDQGISISYFPVYRFLGFDEGQVVAQFGFSKADFPPDALADFKLDPKLDLPHVVYRAENARKSLQYAYALAKEFQDVEDEIINAMLDSYYEKFKLTPEDLLLARQLQQEGEINFIGTDFGSIKHIDPHEGFVAIAHRAYIQDETDEMNHLQMAVRYDSRHRGKTPLAMYETAMIYARVLFQYMQLEMGSLVDQSARALGKQLQSGSGASFISYPPQPVTVGKVHIPNCEIHTVVDPAGTYTCLMPETFYSIKSPAYFFAGDIASFLVNGDQKTRTAAKLIGYGIYNPEKKQLVILTTEKEIVRAISLESVELDSKERDLGCYLLWYFLNL